VSLCNVPVGEGGRDCCGIADRFQGPAPMDVATTEGDEEVR
jgi:hypothetical protein